MSITSLTSENYQQEVVESDKVVLIDFYADWCGPCRALSPTIDEIAEERSDIKVCKVNVDEQKELARKFKVMSIPTLVVIQNGEFVRQCVGPDDKSEILALLD